MRTVTAIAFAAILATTAIAAADDRPQTITIEQGLKILGALRSIDVHPVIVKQSDGKESVQMMPWEYGSPKLRLTIANDITILEAAEKSYNLARLAIVKEVLKDKPAGTQIVDGTPEGVEFTRQYSELIAQPAPGGADLAHIKASDLKLDKNEIPSTVLSGLGPILDQ